MSLHRSTLYQGRRCNHSIVFNSESELIKKVTASRSEKSNIGNRRSDIILESWDIRHVRTIDGVISTRITHASATDAVLQQTMRCSECDKTQMPIHLRRTLHHNSGQRACVALPSSFRYRYSAINENWQIRAACRWILIAYIWR